MNIPTMGIKQKSRYSFNSCSGLCILVGPARFELATNGLKAACSLFAHSCDTGKAKAQGQHAAHGLPPMLAKSPAQKKEPPRT
ncbi:hypothetical protein [Comamonas sp. C11]|uniref:hypothetical protein n=1 Tax=Comamonas sp. C11 TaxID=2966554 RepID=UPI0021128EE7|nr:hypothetical protein [Comamonas sp. C11]UUC95497.1 hypothetical protein NOX35_09470 [Comamonas sp. C11]